MLCKIYSQNFHSIIFLRAGVVAFTDLFYTSRHYENHSLLVNMLGEPYAFLVSTLLGNKVNRREC